MALTPDAATCEACLLEMRDSTDRRHGYPLINCTECGPRFSLVTGVPYDRQKTTMANFALCSRCRAEYENPEDRRFHAQPVCCPECGPALRVTRREQAPTEGHLAMRALCDALAEGGIALIQGLGGFHLASRISREAAERLRRLKRRDAKPFAIMVRNVDVARAWVSLGQAGASALSSHRRPIVLAPRREEVEAEAEIVAPGTHLLGVMLPYTPIHHLIFDDPRLRDTALVMTSANLAHAPMVYAKEDLARFPRQEVDCVLDHDREIARRLDDSILREAPVPRPVRRARGYVPEAIAAPGMPPLLAVGGDLKNAFCLGRDEEALLSAHHGDLAHPAARANFEAEIERWLDFFDVEPSGVACDLHPDFASTRVAERWARQLAVPLL
ncbi:MAG: Sua5/YciO/YrdC/YwlC family protein, partial [Myxococcota bacterium]